MYIDEFLEILTSTTNILKSLEGDTVKYKNGKIAPTYMYAVPNIKKKISTTLSVGILQAPSTSMLLLTR